MRMILYYAQIVINIIMVFLYIACENRYTLNIEGRIFQYAIAFFCLAIPHYVEKEPSEDYKAPLWRFFAGWGIIALSIFLFISEVTSQVWIAYGQPFEETLFRAIRMWSFVSLWGIYVLASGPMDSPIWKEVLKAVFYTWSSILYLGHQGSPTAALLIMSVLMVVEICLNVRWKKEEPKVEFGKYDEIEERIEVDL